jgi:L-prolyl-PCP dehydrogenase
VEFGWTPEQQEAFDATLAAVRIAFEEKRSAGEAAPCETTHGANDDHGLKARQGSEEHYRREDWLRLGELGLLGLCIPARYGGGGFGALDTALRVVAFGRGCTDTGLVFASCAHQFACAVPVAEFGREELRSRLLPRMCAGEFIAGNAMTEAGAGSDVSRLAVTATAVPGGYLLNGQKSFVSNGPVADVYVTYATTDPSAGHLGVTGFVVERTTAGRTTTGLTAGEPFEKMGLSSVPAGTVSFDDCFVADTHVLGEPGQGGAIFQHSMSWERSCLFAGYVGLLDRLIDLCVTHARTRTQFGQRIGAFQSVANRIVDMKLRAESARLLLYRACWELDQGTRSPMNVALAKLAVSESVVASALEAVALFGAAGYLREHGIERVLRDAIPSTIFSGTSDIQRIIVARELGL